MNELTIELVSTALNVAQAQHGVASQNIASFKTQGIKVEENFQQMLTELSALNNKELSDALLQIDNDWDRVKSGHINTTEQSIKLDQESSNLVVHSGKYKVLMEALNRKIGLMNLAVSNKGR